MVYALRLRDGDRCRYCGVRFGSDGQRSRETIDHRLALMAGGGWEMANLVLACDWCNHRKADLDTVEWELSADLHSRRIHIWKSELRRLGFLPSGRGYRHPATFERMEDGWRCPLCGISGATKAEVIDNPCLNSCPPPP